MTKPPKRQSPGRKKPGRKNAAPDGRARERRYSRARHEFYIEPEYCDTALIAAEAALGGMWTGIVWDPASGSGSIPRVFLQAGFDCVASDIVDRDFRPQHFGGRPFRQYDFLSDDPPPFGPVDDIVCNPPYGRARLAMAFILKALTIARRRVVMLVNSRFLYSGRRHVFFTQGHGLARIYHLSRRPSMPPGKALLAGRVKAEGGRQDFCWIVFERGHAGAPRTYWLRGDERLSIRKAAA